MSAPASMSLTELLQGFASDVPSLAVSGVQSDSRRVAPGEVFAAVPGLASQGVDFMQSAEAAGAAAAIWDGAVPPDGAMPRIHVPDLARQLGEIASRFHGHPSQQMFLVGITGTDGKTSCAHILAQALAHMDTRCGYMGTLGIGFPEALAVATHTTPAADAVQRHLQAMLAAGAAAVAMEVSSHALDQARVGGCRFDTAVLTNLGRDHLDYHGSLAHYAAAKRRLFDMPGLKAAVLNADDETGRAWIAELAAAGTSPDLLAYGLSRPDDLPAATLFAQDVELLPDGLRLRLDGDWGQFELSSRLLGRFNAWNLLASLGVLLMRGLPMARAIAALEQVSPVPGRMQRLSASAGKPTVVVDYAHTPNALEAALDAARGHSRGRLICVFGCGGDRDRGKRPLMGGAAARQADDVWITSDNPRSEAPGDIIRDILKGVPADKSVRVEPDRRAAIEQAVAAARAGDVVLIAGKGHEDYQIVGDQRLHFDDREAAQAALARA